MNGKESSFVRGSWWVSQLIQLVIICVIFAIWFEDLDGGVFSSEQSIRDPHSVAFATKIILSLCLVALAWAVHMYSAIRRYNGMGMSGWWVIARFIPQMGPMLKKRSPGLGHGVTKAADR